LAFGRRWRILTRTQQTSDLVRTFTAVVERDPDTGLYVGYVPGFAGAHSQGAALDELQRSLQEVIARDIRLTPEELLTPD